jgi:hypothetical protein
MFSNLRKKTMTRKNNTRNSAKQKYDAFNDMRMIVTSLIKKITAESKRAVNSDPMLRDFNLKRNKDLLLMAAKLLLMSYTRTPVKQISGTAAATFDKATAKEYSKWANNIYSKESIWRDFINTQPQSNVLMYKGKQQYGPFLVPKYSVVKKGETIIVTIKGTSTAADAIIDLLANTESITLGNKKYYAHAGFLRAGTMITSQIKRKIIELLNSNEVNQIIVNGHSLGGGTAHMTGLILYESLLNENVIQKKEFLKFLILGYAPGTTIADPSNTNSLNTYIRNNKKLDILSFVNKQDIVPRLSMGNGIVLLAVLASIAKYVFLSQSVPELDNINISEEDIKQGLLEAKLGRLTRGRAVALSTKKTLNNKRKNMNVFKNLTRKKTVQHQTAGNPPTRNNVTVNSNFWASIGKIRDGIIKLYTSNKKLQIQPPLFTLPIGKIYLWNGNTWSKVNKLDYPKLQKESLMNHLMDGYMNALGQRGGRKKKYIITRKERRKERRKTRRRKRRNKRKIKR